MGNRLYQRFMASHLSKGYYASVELSAYTLALMLILALRVHVIHKSVCNGY